MRTSHEWEVMVAKAEIKVREQAKEIERLRNVMVAVASRPGTDWFIGQLALFEAMQGGGENLDLVLSQAAEAAEEE